MVYGTLTLPGVILAESFISFLGLGVQEPDTSWGVLIADGAQTMESAPWALVFPAALLGTTVWSQHARRPPARPAGPARLPAPGALPPPPAGYNRHPFTMGRAP
jgi:hypothetical protein